jgi:DNA-binding transcriptional ArsR family regulator
MSDQVRFRNFLRHSASVSHAVLRSDQLTLQEKGLYSILCSYGWSGSAFPGQKRLAEENGVTERTIRNHVKRLVELGLITVEDRRKQNKTNIYYIEFPDDRIMKNLFPNGYDHITKDTESEPEPQETDFLRGEDHRKSISSAHRKPVSYKELSEEELTDKDDDNISAHPEFEENSKIEKIKTHFSKKAQKIWYSSEEDMAMIQLLEAGIPVETIIAGIDLAFSRFRPKHSRDRINSFRYCLSAIYELHERGVNHESSSQRGNSKNSGYPEISQGYYDQFDIFAN